MGARKQVRISQCMIVKNEEKNIEKALSWGKSIMWEQIVVDTGSVDGTVELARRAGAKVFSFPWADDFAAAKNYAIGQAKGDWIAFLDADEYMAPEDAEKLFGVLRNLPDDSFDGISTGWQQLDEQRGISASGTQIRFFRNRPDLRYRRRIHEQLVSTEGRKLHVGDVTREISIFHTGYQKEALAGKQKGSRNRRLILKELEENPADYEMMGYMGDECLGDNETGEAEMWYRQAVAHMPPKLADYDQRSAVTFTRLLHLLTTRPQASGEEAEALYEKAVKAIPEEADFDYIMGCFYVNQGKPREAARYLERAVGKLDAYGCNNRALLLAGNLLQAYELLARCCFEAGESEKCVAYSVNYLKYNKYGMAVLAVLLKTLLPHGGDGGGTAQERAARWERQEDKKTAQEKEYQAVMEFLFRIYDSSSLKERLFAVKAAQMAGCQGFAEYMANRLLTPPEREKMGFPLSTPGVRLQS